MPDRSQTSRLRRRVALPPWAIVGLAALAVPRAVVHDLHLAGSAVNAVLALAPGVVWLVAALRTRVPHPLATLLAVGVVHGLLLALTHQILWDQATAGSSPHLGGALRDLPAGAQAAIARAGAVLGSLATGAAIGALVGLLALAATRLRDRSARQITGGGRLR